MSRWFRHYAGMMRDDKLVRASLKAKQSIERTVWVWGAILESAAELDDEGRYEVDAEEIAHFLRCKPLHVEAILEALKNLGRIDGEQVSTWSKRQFKSDRSKDRVTEYRARKRAERNGDVTLQERHRNAPEAETETEEANASPRAGDVSNLMVDLCGIAGIAPPDPGTNYDKHLSALQTVEGWISAGADPSLIRETLTQRCANLRTSPRSLAFFDKPIREAADQRKAETSQVAADTGALIDRILKKDAA